MLRYARFINKYQIAFPPVVKDNISNYHLCEEKLLADGYKPYNEGQPMPADGKQYRDVYVETAELIVRSWEVIETPEPSYSEKRAAEYPPVEEYLDAMVKINSGDEQLIADGQAQLDSYYQACLAVKARYPKPTETETVNDD